MGHWSRALTRVLPALTESVGVDPESAWVKQAVLVDDRPATTATVLQGRGEQLPFPDGHFDLVTCQTVLIHVADVVAVLREMCRVARPAGWCSWPSPTTWPGRSCARAPRRSPAPGRWRPHSPAMRRARLARPLSARGTTLPAISCPGTSPRLGSPSWPAISPTRHLHSGRPTPLPRRPRWPRPALRRCPMSDGSGPVIRRAGTSLRAGGGLRVLGCLVRKVGGDGGRGVRDPQRRSLDRWRQRDVPACGEEAVAAIVGLTCFDGHVR